MSHVPPEVSQEPTAEPAGEKRQGLLARLFRPVRRTVAWIAASRFRMVMAAGTGVALLGAVLTVWLAVTVPEATPPEVTLERALEALDQGEYAEARQLARVLLAQTLPPEMPAGAPAYVLGVAAAADAASATGPRKKDLCLIAARHLREACTQGLPEDRLPDAMYLLGKSLFLAGQVADSQRALEEALKVKTPRAQEIYRILAAAYLQGPVPKLAKALEANAKFLAGPDLTQQDRDRGLLQRAEVFMRLEKPSDCAKTLDQLSPESQQVPEALVLRAEIAMGEARAVGRDQAVADRQRKAREKYDSATQMLRKVQERLSADSPVERKAMYLLGICLLETGDARGALRQFSRTRITEAVVPEVLAASLYEAELSRQSGQTDEAIAAYSRALRQVKDAENYGNPYVSLEQLRRRTMEAYQQYFDAKEYLACLTLLQSFPPAVSEERTLQLKADTCRAWARELLTQSERLPAAKAAPLEKQARSLLRQAGAACQRSAKLHFTARSYVDDLWESANAYLEGHDYEAAARMFREYLRQEVRRRNPQGWTSLGEALLAMDRLDEALAALDRCIDFYPRDAASFRARLLASYGYLQKGDTARAERLLNDNLNGDLLTPASREWQESLFALGQLLHRTGHYEQAIQRLDEAAQRYPDASQTPQALYLIADARRQIAATESAKLAQDATEPARVARSKRIQDARQAAIDGFRQTQDLLLRRQESRELRPLEKATLRGRGPVVRDRAVRDGRQDLLPGRRALSRRPGIARGVPPSRPGLSPPQQGGRGPRGLEAGQSGAGPDEAADGLPGHDDPKPPGMGGGAQG